MIDSFLGRLAQAGTFRALFQAAASLVAVATVLACLGYGTPSLTDGDAGDGRLAVIEGSPLAVIYRGLRFFGIPHEWVSTVGAYLAESPGRAAAFSIAAILLGCAVTCTLSPTTNVPSLQASTWWVCAAVAAQCGYFGTLLVWLAVWLIGRSLRHRDAGEAGLDLIQLAGAALAAPLLTLHLIFDRWRP